MGKINTVLLLATVCSTALHFKNLGSQVFVWEEQRDGRNTMSTLDVSEQRKTAMVTSDAPMDQGSARNTSRSALSDVVEDDRSSADTADAIGTDQASLRDSDGISATSAAEFPINGKSASTAQATNNKVDASMTEVHSSPPPIEFTTPPSTEEADTPSTVWEQSYEAKNATRYDHDGFNTPSVQCRLDHEQWQNQNIEHWMANPEYPMIEWIWELTDETTGETYYQGLFHVLLCGYGSCSVDRANNILNYHWSWQDQFGVSHKIAPMQSFDMDFEPRIYFRMDPPKHPKGKKIVPKSLVALNTKGKAASPMVYDLQPYLRCNTIEKENPPPPDTKIGACITRFWGQHDLMPEWIAYHRMIGIQHFWIFVSEPFENIYETMPRHETDISYIPYDFSWERHKHNGDETMVTAVDGFSAGGENWFQNYASVQCLYMAKQYGLDWVMAPDADEYVVLNNPDITHFSSPSPLEQFFQSHKFHGESERCSAEKDKDARAKRRQRFRAWHEQKEKRMAAKKLREEQEKANGKAASSNGAMTAPYTNKGDTNRSPSKVKGVQAKETQVKPKDEPETEKERKARKRERFREWHRQREARLARKQEEAKNKDNQRRRLQEGTAGGDKSKDRDGSEGGDSEEGEEGKAKGEDVPSTNYGVGMTSDNGYVGPVRQICLYGASYGKHLDKEVNKTFELSLDFTYRKNREHGSGECRDDGHGAGGRRKCFYNPHLITDVHVHGMRDDEPRFRGTSHALTSEIELFHFRSPLLGPRHTKRWKERPAPSHQLVSYPQTRDLYRDKVMRVLKRQQWALPKFGKHVCMGYTCGEKKKDETR